MKQKSIFLALIGVLSIIFGLYILGLSTGYYESDKAYGGDAYTGIQNAGAQAANNVQDAAEIEKYGFSFVLIVAGLYMINGSNIFVKKSKDQATPAVTPATTPTVPQAAPATNKWVCECGKENTNNFCEECGKPKK